jgi:hypothetical protein
MSLEQEKEKLYQDWLVKTLPGLKAKYGDGAFRALKIGGQNYVYKYITAEEMDLIQAKFQMKVLEDGNLSPEDEKLYNEMIVKAHIVYPEDFNPNTVPAMARPKLFSEIGKEMEFEEEPHLL